MLQHEKNSGKNSAKFEDLMNVLMSHKMDGAFDDPQYPELGRLFKNMIKEKAFDREAMKAELSKHMPAEAIESMLDSISISINSLLEKTS